MICASSLSRFGRCLFSSRCHLSRFILTPIGSFPQPGQGSFLAPVALRNLAPGNPRELGALMRRGLSLVGQFRPPRRRGTASITLLSIY